MCRRRDGTPAETAFGGETSFAASGRRSPRCGRPAGPDDRPHPFVARPCRLWRAVEGSRQRAGPLHRVAERAVSRRSAQNSWPPATSVIPNLSSKRILTSNVSNSRSRESTATAADLDDRARDAPSGRLRYRRRQDVHAGSCMAHPYARVRRLISAVDGRWFGRLVPCGRVCGSA